MAVRDQVSRSQLSKEEVREKHNIMSSSVKNDLMFRKEMKHTLITQALISGDPLLARTISVFGLMIDFWKIFSLSESGIMSMIVDSSRNRPRETVKQIHIDIYKYY